jgi:hypothetical protein
MKFICAIMLITLAGGCAGEAAPDTALEQCIIGWWQVPDPGGGCICPSAPECQFSDCAGYPTVGFLADHRYFSGYLSISKQSCTMTSLGMSHGTYAVRDGGVHVDQPPDPSFDDQATCSAARLSLKNGQAVLVRASSQLAAALDRATADGGVVWTSYRFCP